MNPDVCTEFITSGEKVVIVLVETKIKLSYMLYIVCRSVSQYDNACCIPNARTVLGKRFACFSPDNLA